jgi:hypothetical protein
MSLNIFAGISLGIVSVSIFFRRLGQLAAGATKERTFIHSLGDEKFAAVGEGKKLAFACSLQEQVSTMGHWGLEPRHSTPNFEGLREYLRHRWRYWDLDVEHPPIFDSAVSVLPK